MAEREGRDGGRKEKRHATEGRVVKKGRNKEGRKRRRRTIGGKQRKEMNTEERTNDDDDEEEETRVERVSEDGSEKVKREKLRTEGRRREGRKGGKDSTHRRVEESPRSSLRLR